MRPRPPGETIVRYGNMLNALGTEPRLRIMRLVLSSHPTGMVVGSIQKELGLPASNLSHHLEKLKNKGLATVRRDALFCGTRLTRRYYRGCSGFSIPSAAPGTAF